MNLKQYLTQTEKQNGYLQSGRLREWSFTIRPGAINFLNTDLDKQSRHPLRCVVISGVTVYHTNSIYESWDSIHHTNLKTQCIQVIKCYINRHYWIVSLWRLGLVFNRCLDRLCCNVHVDNNVHVIKLHMFNGNQRQQNTGWNSACDEVSIN